MLGEGKLSVVEKRLAIAVFLGLTVALFLNLGIYPLTQEEPRRGFIALEMIFSENWIVPTQTGELYFKKPPFYNWLLILSYKLFGSYSELATRVVSVASFLMMGVVFFRFARKHVNEVFATYSSLFFLVSVDILFYFSALGEIDLFYSLITLLVFLVIYDFGEKRQYLMLFTLAYFLSAVGFLTKGLPSILFVGISLLVYFIMKKDFKRLFSISHFVGLLVFVAVVGGYFWWYSQYQDPSGWWSTIISESSDRTVGNGFLKMLKHVFLFPIDTLKNLLPATFFLPFLFTRPFLTLFKKNQFICYIALIFATNILIYWISPGAKSRYVYPLYPLLTGVFVYAALTHLKNIKWGEKYLKVICVFVGTVMILGSVTSFFIPRFEIVQYGMVISTLVIPLILFMILISVKRPQLRLLMLVVFFTIMRVGFSVGFSVIRAETSGAKDDKNHGIQIAKLTAENPLHLYRQTSNFKRNHILH